MLSQKKGMLTESRIMITATEEKKKKVFPGFWKKAVLRCLNISAVNDLFDQVLRLVVKREIDSAYIFSYQSEQHGGHASKKNDQDNNSSPSLDKIF